MTSPRTYTRDDVQRRGWRPAVNVKDYSNTYAAVHRHFRDYAESAIDEAHQRAWDGEVAAFWDDWSSRGHSQQASDRDGRFYFGGQRVTVECEGRSGGWLVVGGLRAVDAWDAADLGMWRRFERDVLSDAHARQSAENMIYLISGGGEPEFAYLPESARNCAECGGTMGDHEPECEYVSDELSAILAGDAS